jgi:ubiquinone/menaquinone biosynthesis C-methylase UbiE
MDVEGNLEFDDETSRVVEEFNRSQGAMERRRRIVVALALQPGEAILDVGSGPGNQVFEMSSIVGPGGRVQGIDPAESAIAIASRRCSGLSNVHFELGDVAQLPFDDGTFDAVMSSQVFEYLQNVKVGLKEIYRVLRPGGRVLIHDTDWGAWLWRSSDPQRMARVMEVWDKHLADPHLPQTLAPKLRDAGFSDIKVEPIVQIETEYDPGSVSGILMNFIVGYVESQGMSASETSAWKEDLEELGTAGDYFFSSTEYVFLGRKSD